MCRKNKYSKKIAQTILNERLGKHKKYAAEKRIYYCDICKAHHLTSKEEYNEIIEIPFDELIYKEEWAKLKG